MEQADLEAIVKETRDLARANNDILNKMVRNAKRRFWFNIIFWALIIISSVYFTYVLAVQLTAALSGNGAGSSPAIQNLIQQYGGGQ